jgi:hypothetical protein
MNDLSPAERLAKLRVLREWLEWQLNSTLQKISELEQAAGQSAGYVLEPKPNPKHPAPALIHVAGCTMTNRKTSPVTEHNARLSLTKDRDHFAPCEFCAPDKELGLEGG